LRTSARPEERDPEGAQDAEAGKEREPPQPVFGPPGNNAEEDRGYQMEGKLPLIPPDREDQEREGQQTQERCRGPRKGCGNDDSRDDGHK
jgi:hypothetical protein